jgi:diketogulonate reductase-like aldo/keto reductase
VTAVPDVTLNNGQTIPQFGFGVFLVRPVDTAEAVASVTPARIRENIAIFDFELPGEDVETITALNKNQRTGPDPDTFNAIN